MYNNETINENDDVPTDKFLWNRNYLKFDLPNLNYSLKYW